MDLASIVGLVMCLVLVVFGITFDEGKIVFDNLTAFLHGPSAIITFGGAFCCILAMCGDFKDFFGKLKTASKIMKVQQNEIIESIKKLIQFSNVARKEGLLALEESANNLEEPFMKN